MHNLLVRLKKGPDESLTIEWVAISEDGGLQSSADAGSGSKIDTIAKEAQSIIVSVPSEEILLTSVKMPKLTPYKLAQAVPFALEDHVTEDTANLHFALGDRADGDPLPVAVVGKAAMQQWKEFLVSKLGPVALNIKYYVPDVLMVPYKPDTVQIYVDGNVAIVRTGSKTGFAIEKSQVYSMLLLLFSSDHYQKPSSIQIHLANNEQLFSEEEKADLGVEVEYCPRGDNLLTVMAKEASNTIEINLLQGSFAPMRKRATMEQVILAGFGVVAAWMLFLTVMNVISMGIIYREKFNIKSVMGTIYSQIVPNQPVPSDMKRSLQMKLNKLRADRSSSEFMRLVQIVVAEYMPLRSEQIQVNDVMYRNNQLKLDVEARSSEVLDKFKVELEDAGLDVVVSNAQRNTKGMIEMQLTVEELT